jgi:hypothetical protein
MIFGDGYNKIYQAPHYAIFFSLISFYFLCYADVQVDSKLLSGFLWSINGKPDNNLESRCIFRRTDEATSLNQPV